MALCSLVEFSEESRACEESKPVIHSIRKDAVHAEIESFINDCFSEFHRTVIYIRCLASENAQGHLLAAPYGKVCFSKPMVFKQLTLEYGMEDAERHFEFGIPVIDIRVFSK